MNGIFPDIVLYNPFHIGDNVLIEPVANILAIGMNKVYVASNHPELFIGHPNIIGVDAQASGVPKDAKMIDLTDALKVLDVDGNIITNKVQRIYDACGVKTSYHKESKLYLTNDEQQIAREFKQSINGKSVCVVPCSRTKEKDWPYFRKLIIWLLSHGYQVFIGDKSNDILFSFFDKRIRFLIGLQLREFMAKLSVMDLVISNDTGPAHIALALGIPTIVIGFDICTDHYAMYDNCSLITSRIRKQYGDLRTISVHKVIKVVKSYKLEV